MALLRDGSSSGLEVTLRTRTDGISSICAGRLSGVPFEHGGKVLRIVEPEAHCNLSNRVAV